MTRDRFMALIDAPALTPADLDELIASGDVEECPNCFGRAAYAHGISHAFDYFLDDYHPRPGLGHIGTAGWDTWTCPHCDTPWVKTDSPLNHPCYTHSGD